MHVNKNIYMYVYPSQSSKTRNPSFCYSSLEIPNRGIWINLCYVYPWAKDWRIRNQASNHALARLVMTKVTAVYWVLGRVPM